MTDFQFKKVVQMVYGIVEAKFDAGKSHTEVLSAIRALMEDEPIKVEPIGKTKTKADTKNKRKGEKKDD